MAAQIEFRVFISYSKEDQQWADWLRRALEAYRVPGRLLRNRGQYVPPDWFGTVYVAGENFSTSQITREMIEFAISRSGYMVVICSPNSATSSWVSNEIQAFQNAGRGDRIIPLIVDGEPHAFQRGLDPELECFPLALRYPLDTPKDKITGKPLSLAALEPIAADVREGRDGRHVAKLKIIARLLGIPFDQLRRRDRGRIFFFYEAAVIGWNEAAARYGLPDLAVVRHVMAALAGGILGLMTALRRIWLWIAAPLAAAALGGAALAGIALLDEAGAKRGPDTVAAAGVLRERGGEHLVAVAGSDGVARVYRDDVLIAGIRGHDAPIEHMAFLGDTLVTSDAAGTTQVTALHSLAATGLADADPLIDAFQSAIWFPYGRPAAARWLAFLRGFGEQRQPALYDDGRGYKFGAVTVQSSIHELTPQSLRPLIKISPGSAYDPQQVQRAVDALTNAAGAKGYAFVQVEPAIARYPDKGTIDIVLTIDQSPRTKQMQMILDGLKVSRPTSPSIITPTR